MGYKILDVKTEIHEDIEEYFKNIAASRRNFGYARASRGIEQDVLDIVDKHFEKIER